MSQRFYRFALLFLFHLLVSFGRTRAQEVYQSIGSFRESDFPFAATEPLCVALPAPMPEPYLSKKYKKAEARAAYLAEIAAQRSAFELAIKHWQLSPVVIITEEQGKQYMQDKQQKHMVLAMGLAPMYNVNNSITWLPALVLSSVGGKSSIGISTNYAVLCGQWYWPFDKRAWQDIYPASELVPAVQQLQAYVQQRAQAKSPRSIQQEAEAGLGKNAGLLGSRTLLLAQNQLSKNLTPESLSKLYAFPVKLTDQATLDAAVAAADSRYVYVRYVTIRKDNGYQLLDASNGKVLGWSQVHASRREDAGHLEDGDLKQLVKTAAGK